MANEEQLKILKSGVESWNDWRAKHDSGKVNLFRADLRRTDLRRANLIRAYLANANLSGANLGRANLREATLCSTNLSRVCLIETNLVDANLYGANLYNADLRRADLRRANLIRAKLVGANVGRTNFHESDLQEANLTNANADLTYFVDVDLSQIEGLESVQHAGPSEISISTIYRSGGKIPEIFLRGAGIPDVFIANMKSLVAAMGPIEFYSCFISYSSKDHAFADRLYADLQANGVRCWFAPEDLKIGGKLRPSFDEAISLHDKLLVVLSKNSVKSPWVEKEVETAFEKERQQNRTVLFPIRLDDAIMETHEAWAADIRRTRNVGDFRNWKNHDSYKKTLDHLLRDLQAEGKSKLAA